MSKVITAEYDAKNQSLKLAEPLAGVKDHEKVKVAIEKEPADEAAERPWMKYEGILSPDAGDDLSRAIEEMFGHINA